MALISDTDPEQLAELLKNALVKGCSPAGLLSSKEGVELVSLVAPEGHQRHTGVSRSTRADYASQSLGAACARLSSRCDALRHLLGLADDADDKNLTERREDVATMGFADSGDSFRRRKEAAWMFEVAVELQILVEGSYAPWVRAEQLEFGLP